MAVFGISSHHCLVSAAVATTFRQREQFGRKISCWRFWRCVSEVFLTAFITIEMIFVERNSTALAVKSIAHHFLQRSCLQLVWEVPTQYFCIQCDMHDIRAFFTVEYLHSRVLKDIEEQTMNSELKLKLEHNWERREFKNQHSILYFTFDW